MIFTNDNKISQNSQPKPKDKKQNTHEKPYTLYVTENEIVLCQNQSGKYLFVDRQTCQASLLNEQVFLAKKITLENPRLDYGVFGRIQIKEIEFLILITNVKKTAEIHGKNIYQITSVKFITLNKEKYSNFLFEKCIDHLDKIKNYIKSGFYFSYDYPLHSQFKGS